MKTKKKSYHPSAGPIAGTVPYNGKSSPSYRITFIKRLDVSLNWELLEQKLSISPGLGIHLNWQAKTESRGVLVVNIVLNYCCERKMIKEIKTEETLVLFVTFLSLVTFQLGGRALCPPLAPLMFWDFFSEMRKLLASSEAEFNSSVGADMGSKPSGTKAAVIFAFGNKF